MAQASLGEMIIRIVGDTALFDSSVDKSKVTLNNFYKELEKADAEFKKLEEAAKKADLEKNLKLKEAVDKTKKLGDDLTKFVTLPIIGLGTLAVKNFAESEDAAAKFNAALLATGKQTSINVESIKALTAELQKTTVYEDDAQLAALGLVQSLANLDENGLKAILPRMLDFSASMGVDLQTAASLFGKTLGSTTNALGRYGIQIEDGLTGDKKLLALTTALDSKFKDYAETTAKLGTGPMKQLLNTLGDLGESFGEVILPVINELIPPIKEAITAFGNLDTGTKKTIVVLAGLAAAIGPVLSIGAQLITMVTTIGSSFAAVGAVGGPILVVAASLGVLVNEVLKYKKNAEETIAIQEGFIKVMDGSKQSLDDFKKSLVVFETSPAILKKDLEGVNKAIADTQKQIDAFSKGLVDQGPTKIFTFESERTDPLAKQRQEVARLRDELEKLKATRDSLNQQLNKVAPQETKRSEDNLSSGLQEFQLEDELLKQKLLNIDFGNILQQQAEDELALIDAKIRAKEEEKKKEKELQDIIVQTAQYTQKGVNFIADLSSTLSNNRMIEINDEYNRQKKAIEDTITDEKAKKDAIESLDKQYEEKKRVEKRKAAEAEKAWNITQSIINTAVAVVEALPDIPLSIVAGATGAAQTALIAAQAIPEFATGGFVPATPGGQLARVAEAGRGEFMLPDRPDFMNMLANRITSGMQQPINNTFSPNINNSINGPMVLSIDGQQFKAYINQQSAKGNIQISPKRGIAKR